MSRKPILSLDDFKKWMETQDEDEPESEAAPDVVKVYSKISPKKLIAKITVEDGEEEDLIEDFIQDGGIVLESIDGLLLIDVNAGRFYLNEKYVKQI